ncbi:ABC transporter permease [Strepomyces sp. STD 3.1]|nr:ABC transporter permease [Streptomyces sp. STD 3.1]
MTAVWRAARAAVARRRLQTVVVGVVVLMSTTSIVVALALLDSASAPFDKAFAEQRGPHAVATYNAAKVSDEQLADAARQPGVEEVAGPFSQAVLDIPEGIAPGTDGPQSVVGRAEPGGPLDRVDLWKGRWATAPGEIVLNLSAPSQSLLPFGSGGKLSAPLGGKIEIPGLPTLTVVGFAHSLSNTAGAWVAPEQIDALHPTSTQMMYRFADSATEADLRAAMAAVTKGLSKDSLVAAQSYLVIKDDIAAGPGVYTPFLVAFGGLGLLVAVLIVANVVSGAVISGVRHIGVLKSLGFTPHQVVAVYLVMVLTPAVVATVSGTVIGYLAAQPLLSTAFRGMGLGDIGISPWVVITALLGMPAVVALAALVPALRAHRLSPSEALLAGSAPHTGRGLRIQRRLSVSRLPRSASLGLGLPFARPGRTGLTVAAVLLGVTTTTFATGLSTTVTKYADATSRAGAVQVTVQPGTAKFGMTESKLNTAQTEAKLRSLPGAAHVTAQLVLPVSLTGYTQGVNGYFFRGDHVTLGYQNTLVEGRWLEKAGEIVTTSEFLNKRKLEVGDSITLETSGGKARAEIVGTTMAANDSVFYANWQTLTQLGTAYDPHEIEYQIQLAPGTDAAAYSSAVKAADPGLYPRDPSTDGGSFQVTMVSFSTVLALMLATVAALGVFNTVVLNTRERRRDLGMLKSIGMTPRQVTVMMLTSMAALGVIGGLIGLPLGVIAHSQILPMVTDAARVDIPDALLDVWHAPGLVLLALTGVVIAMLGALIPARSAGRLTIAEVLRSE